MNRFTQQASTSPGRRPRLLALAVIGLAVLGTAGCGEDADGRGSTSPGAKTASPTAASPTAASPAPADARSLVGEYTFQIGSDDFVARLGADGSAKIYVEGELDAAGTYAVNGAKLTVRDEKSGVGGFCAGPGRYRWSLAGDQLSMSLVSEECPGRTELWTAGWTKVSDTR